MAFHSHSLTESTPRRAPTASGRPYPEEVVAAARTLIEEAGLSYREAAARSGLREDTIGRWARRFGWRRAAGPARVGAADAAAPIPPWRGGPSRSEASSRGGDNPAEEAPHPGRLAPTRPPLQGGIAPDASSRGGDIPAGEAPHPGRLAPTRPPLQGGIYPPEVREAARLRVEGTREGLERIADELGIARWTLHRWSKRFGWRRPAPPERPVRPGKRGPDFYRSRRLGRPYGGDAVGTARDLVTGSNLPLHRVAERAGISRATLYRWIARRGWTRHPAAAKGRRFRSPYPPEVVAAARELFQTTGLSPAFIAARVKATPERIGHWARTKGWGRPRDLPNPDGSLRRRRRRGL